MIYRLGLMDAIQGGDRHYSREDGHYERGTDTKQWGGDVHYTMVGRTL